MTIQISGVPYDLLIKPVATARWATIPEIPSPAAM
jgi:hypothetical protein